MLTINGHTRLYAVFGNPINHSQSPKFHCELFQLATQNAVLLAFAHEDGAKVCSLMRDLPIVGAAITRPLKQSVIEHLDELSPEAAAVDAVNTIIQRDERLIGYNTDIPGFFAPLKPYSAELAHAVITIIGYGGAARAAYYALEQNLNIRELYVIGRDSKSAEIFIKWATQLNNSVVMQFIHTANSKELKAACYRSQLIVQATPLGMTSIIPETPIAPDLLPANALFYELIYSPRETPLVTAIRAKNGTVILGEEMFAMQALIQNQLFTGMESALPDFREITIN